ncbi:hypothetical protein KEM48_007933 [Puccinia striiformis f. sp. tritici PST-130]|nr:hypothetical protein KEM48_007933 [Puccinia striiformis f. sp. tritici PST-130]
MAVHTHVALVNIAVREPRGKPPSPSHTPKEWLGVMLEFVFPWKSRRIKNSLSGIHQTVHEGAPGTSWKDGTPGKFWEDGKAIAKASTPAPHPAAAGDGAPGKSWEDNKIVAKAPTSGSHPTPAKAPRKILGRRSPHVRRSATSEPPLMISRSVLVHRFYDFLAKLTPLDRHAYTTQSHSVCFSIFLRYIGCKTVQAVEPNGVRLPPSRRRHPGKFWEDGKARQTSTPLRILLPPVTVPREILGRYKMLPKRPHPAPTRPPAKGTPGNPGRRSPHVAICHL